MTRTLILASFAGLLGGIALAQGDVVINELSAISSDRLLRWDSNDQPHVGSGHPWWSGPFDDSQWQSGNTPIGFDLGAISTNVGSLLKNVSPSLYVRKDFSASAAEAASNDNLVLRINYNDGFIAWLNGTEVGRSRMGPPKAHVYHDQVAYTTAANSTATQDIVLGMASDLLQPGDNVLAIQIGNQSIGSSLRLEMSLLLNQSVLIPTGSTVSYFPGLMEPSSDVYEPAAASDGASDWVELCNTGPAVIDIANWSLTDDPSILDKWLFPAGTSIPVGGHLLVLADEPDAPIPGASFLHASFKLGSGGEYLGLFDDSGVAQSQLNPGFPKQFNFHSYGIGPGGEYVYCAMPTPGASNAGTTYLDKADAPDFDNKGGFYDNAVTVTLSSHTPGAAIRYTTDGTEPTLDNGTDYNQPLVLNQVTTRKGHVIRARAFLAGMIPSNTKTHTFLIGQDARLRTAPALVYAADLPRSLYDPYGVLAIQGGTYPSSQWRGSLPTDFNNVINRGRAYERPVHVEFYFPNGEVGFRTDAGVRIAASSYSRPRMMLNQVTSSPWPASSVQKPSFNLYFRDEYGNPDVSLPLNGRNAVVNTYERFRVRAGKNDIRNPFIIDELVRRMSWDMGQPASRGSNNSLYVNGELKGFFNTVERLREPFFRSLHSEDPNAQWDVLQFEGNDNIAEGDKVAWNNMISRLGAATTVPNWDRVLEFADVVNMADYYLLNIYMAMWDWPHNNWVAAKERSSAGRYRLYVWDAEGGMNNKGNRPVSQEMINSFIASGSGELRDLWRGLNRWEEFRLLFADRINKHLFNGGVLDDRDYANSHVKALQDALVGEFSDLLRVMNNQTVTTSHSLNWASATNGRRRYMFGPVREEFRNNNLWPELTPPAFSKFGGSVAGGFPLNITSESGLIYYTTDGSDPRQPGGEPNPGSGSFSGAPLDLTLIAQDGTWNYLDDGTDLTGTDWGLRSYDDSGWGEGQAVIGTGGINITPVVTEVNPKIDGVRPITFYVRKSFEIDEAAAFLELRYGLMVDDGAAVYLNGVEVTPSGERDGLPDGPIDANTQATSGTNEGIYDERTIDPALLIDGTNVLAIEVHNRTAGSSDMGFDLWLTAKRSNPASNPVFIHGPTTVMARTYDNGVWSALTAADFTVETEPASTANLAITEMLYNPAGPSTEEQNAGITDGDQFEYLRVNNIGTMAVDLHGVRFVDGITFDFSTSSIRALAPGGVAIIVSDLAAFRQRFGSAHDGIIAGEYSGQLNNGGEHVRLIDNSDGSLQDFTYAIVAPWPFLGGALDGHSVQIIDPSANASHDDGTNWAASATVGGNPGGSLSSEAWRHAVFTPAQLADPTISAWDADIDGDGLTTFAEFALGTSPLSVDNGIPMPVADIEDIGGQDYLTLEFTRAAGERDVTISAQVTSDLATWNLADLVVGSETVNPDGTITVKYQDTVPADPAADRERYMRLHMSE